MELSLARRMPAEWEKHDATWIAWPHHEPDWPGKLAVIPWVYGEIVRALARHEPVNLIVPDAEAGTAALDVLARSGANVAHVRLWELPTDRSWVRDSGPIFVVNAAGERAVLDWQFNAWAKYADWTLDDKVPEFVAEKYGLPRWQPRLRGHRLIQQLHQVATAPERPRARLDSRPGRLWPSYSPRSAAGCASSSR